MGHITESKQLLQQEKDYPRCRLCGQRSEHAKVLDGCCPQCFVREGLSIKKEYAESHLENPPWGKRMD